MSVPKSTEERTIGLTPSRWRVARPGIVGIAVLAVLWLMPLTALALSHQQAKVHQEQSVSGSTRSVVTVGSRQATAKQAVSVTINTDSAPAAVAQLAGTVTSVKIRPSDSVASYSRLFDLDRHPVFAISEEVPLYRNLTLGDSGSDVLSLSRFLVRAELLDESAVDSRFGPRIRAAVKEFQSQNGYEQDGVFEKSYVIFVPLDFGAISHVGVKTGQDVTGSWTVMTGTPLATSVHLSSVSDGASLSGLGDGPVDLYVGSERVGLSSISPDASQAMSILATLTAGVGRGDITVNESASEEPKVLQFSGASVVKQSTTVAGSVPATAIHTSSAGVSCVFESGSPKEWRALGMKVQVLASAQADASELGQSLIDAGLIGRSIARDPSNLPTSIREKCGS